MSDLKRRADRLASARRRLLELRLEQKGLSIDDVYSREIERSDGLGPFPLSFSQQFMWLLHQLEEGAPTYNISKVFKVKGDLNCGALKEALKEIVTRHEVLRSTYQFTGGQLETLIKDEWSLELPVIDIRDQEDQAKEDELQRLLEEEIRCPFDLTRDLMLRCALVRLGIHEHILLIVTHHIASDNWSSSVLYRELSELYGAFSEGQPSSLPELPIRYVDYAIWQRSRLQGERLQDQLAYWREQLKEAPAILELPADRARPDKRTYRGARYTWVLPAQLSLALRRLSQREKSTLVMTLLAGLNVLLYRYTGQTDIMIGSPIAGRTRVEMEGLIGVFINTLVLRCDLTGKPTFRELLQRVRKMTLDAYANQELPFERLVEELQPERELGRTPFYRVLFDSLGKSGGDLRLAGLQVSHLELATGATAFDLVVFVSEQEGDLKITYEYDTDLFGTATIERMSRHFQTLLVDIVAHPDRSIENSILLTEAERKQILVEWNDPTLNFPMDKCAHKIFEDQVERCPNALAVVNEDQQMSYQQLNVSANQLAHYLRILGVGPDVLVGLCVDRSLEMIVGMLGILKAGGAYVPLDPLYPQEQLRFILTDTGAPVVVTQKRLVPNLPASEAKIVDLISDKTLIHSQVTTNLETIGELEHLAYVVYTSGTTGTPKGVMINQHGLTWHTQTTANMYDITARDRVLQFHSMNFDSSVLEIFPCLGHGGTLVLRNDEMLNSVNQFFEACEAWGVTIIHLPTVFWHELAFELARSRTSLPSCLRVVSFGGERVLPERVEGWRQSVGGQVRLINGYGPTETTVSVTHNWLSGESGEGGAWRAELIGRPRRGVQTYILDRNLEPVPVGIPGELCIGGHCVGRGYLNRVEKTAERFIPAPFSPTGGERLYRTGDVARYAVDGNIEFLGRKDSQVKIRGYRVELGQIEAVMSELSSVSQAVVLDHEERPGDRRLVAYVVPDSGEQLDEQSLRDYLVDRLPEYMIPSAFVFLASLPRMPSGKVDRKSLLIPSRTLLNVVDTYVPPRNELEQQLCMIWEEVLESKPIGVHDNFFELGGHSLLAMRLLSQIEMHINCSLPIALLFESPTILELTEEIERMLLSERHLETTPEGVEGDWEEIDL